MPAPARKKTLGRALEAEASTTSQAAPSKVPVLQVITLHDSNIHPKRTVGAAQKPLSFVVRLTAVLVRLQRRGSVDKGASRDNARSVSFESEPSAEQRHHKSQRIESTRTAAVGRGLTLAVTGLSLSHTLFTRKQVEEIGPDRRS